MKIMSEDKRPFFKIGSEVEKIFREMYVKLSCGIGNEFEIPMGIKNYYSLEVGDALYCEIVSLQDKGGENVRKIGVDVLVDIFKENEGVPLGRIPEAIFDLYEMQKNEYAHLRIKGIIREKY